VSKVSHFILTHTMVTALGVAISSLHMSGTLSIYIYCFIIPIIDTILTILQDPINRMHAPAHTCVRNDPTRQRIQSQAILSMSQIRYRYSRPAAVHGVDIANRPGESNGTSGPSGDTDRDTRAVAHRVLHRKGGPPGVQMQNPDVAMDRDQKVAAPP
jgi:hypothetical protein